MANPVVHFEIAGPDGPALKRYYSGLFGWDVQDAGPDMGNYGLVSAAHGGIGGGIMETTDDMGGMENFVTFYIEVDDLQAALDKIGESGGSTIVPPTEIAPGVGSVAMFLDPAQNAIGLYAQSPDWDGVMPPKVDAPPVVHFELGGSDAAALEDFYTKNFGWQVNAMDMPDGMSYRLIEQAGEYGIGGGIFQHMDGMPPNVPGIAIGVDDLQGYLDKAVSLGGTALMQPDELPGEFGSIAIFNDIAGNRISLFAPPADN